jgi:hypothetical protein
MRLARTWLPLLLTALLTALSGAALSAPHFLCHMTGRVVADCCCTADAAPPCEPSVSAADCCERLNARPRADVDRTLCAADGIAPAALAATLEEPPYVGPRSRRENAVIHAGRGPPASQRLFVVHCAFLI